jgi:hypothetical protein
MGNVSAEGSWRGATGMVIDVVVVEVEMGVEVGRAGRLEQWDVRTNPWVGWSVIGWGSLVGPRDQTASI